MPTQTLVSDAVLATISTGTASTTYIQAQDAQWIVAGSTTVAPSIRTSIQNPTNPPSTGASLQVARVQTKKQGGSGTPTATISVGFNGTKVLTSPSFNVTSTTGQVNDFAFDWQALLTAGANASGSDFEMWIDGSPSGGGPSARASVDTGYMAWIEFYSTSVSHSGAAALSGTGTIVASALVTRRGASALAGSGTLTASSVAQLRGAAAVSGAGTATATGRNTVRGAFSLSGMGTLAADATVEAGGQVHAGAVSLAGAGSLQSAGRRNQAAAAVLSGAGSSAAAGRRTQRSSAALSGAGTLSAAGVRTLIGQAMLSGTSVAAMTGQLEVKGAASLAGQGFLSAHFTEQSGGTLVGHACHSRLNLRTILSF